MIGEVRAAVEDWPAMRARALEIAQELEASPPPVADQATWPRRSAFLAWLEDHNFTFLGYREYERRGRRAR